MATKQHIEQGIENLLVNCAAIQPDDKLVIICEDPALGWYDAEAPQAVAQAAKTMGVTPTILHVGAPENTANPDVVKAIADHDCTIYFTRIGDQDRFGELAPGKRSVMCYIRSLDMLAAPFGRASYGGFRQFKTAIDDILLSAEKIEVTCPLGTQFGGCATDAARQDKTDVSVLRFPLGVPMPLDAAQFSGRVAITHFLTPTGSRSYTPANLKLEKTTFAVVENGRIVGFEGDELEVARINQHYDRVAEEFDLDRSFVHSWHAGIHPGSTYPFKAKDDPDRWSNSVFTNPRFLHFHTCGAYAPAEICWMVLDHTISVDGVNLWQNGRLCPENFAQTRDCLEQWPELQPVFDNPSQDIGL